MKQPQPVKAWAVVTKSGKICEIWWNRRKPHCVPEIGESVIQVSITPIPKKGKP